MAAIVGFEIEITHLTGKWKVSQNRPAEDVPTLVAGLNVAGKPEMAELLVQAR